MGRGGSAGGMTVVWEYAADLFDPATAERMFAHFRRALEAVADADVVLLEKPFTSMELLAAVHDLYLSP